MANGTQHVFVTGASGFTGGHLCKRLVNDGYHVRALVRTPQQAEQLSRIGVEPCEGDLRDLASLEGAMEGVHTVYHIAAAYRVAKTSQQEFQNVNLKGTQNMLDAAIKAGVKRFVHCSTVGVHGDVKNPPANESAPFDPDDDYQISKLAAEEIVRRYSSEGRLPITIFRPAGIYGPGDMRFLKLVKSVKNGTFVMIGSGETLFHMVYIDDLVDGILLCGTHPNAVGQLYILAGGEIVSLNELVKLIAKVVESKPPRFRIPYAPVYYAGYACEILCKPLGINPPIFRRRVAFFKKNRAFDISKATSELGYQPKVDLETGLAHTARWYKEHGHL